MEPVHSINKPEQLYQGLLLYDIVAHSYNHEYSMIIKTVNYSWTSPKPEVTALFFSSRYAIVIAIAAIIIVAIEFQ